MKKINYLNFKKKSESFINSTIKNNEQIIVMKNNNESFAIVPIKDLEDLSSYRETEYLMQDKELVRRIEECNRMFN